MHYAGHDSHRATDPVTGEIVNVPDQVGMRAYHSMWQGVVDHVAYVHYRASPAWREATTNGPRNFMSILRRTGYFEGYGQTDAELDSAFGAAHRLTEDALGRGGLAVGAMADGYVSDAAIGGAVFVGGLGLFSIVKNTILRDRDGDDDRDREPR